MNEDQKKEQKNSQKKEQKSDGRVWWAVGIILVIALAVGYYLGTGDDSSFDSITGNVIFGQGSAIKLGFMGPLTGEAASYGNSIKKGVDLALEDSGISNRIEMVYEDSLCEGKTSVTAINKLISVDNVIAIIGEACSGATIPAAPIAEENRVVLISPASTSPEITDLGAFIFRTVPSDTLQGDFAADMMYDRGYRKLAVLFSQEDYGVGLSNVLIEEFEDRGGEVVASEAFERGSTDLRTQITKIKDAKPDALYFISNSPDAAVAGLKQIRQLGIKATLFASEGLKSPDILEAGSASQGLTITSVSAGTKEFAENFEAVYGEAPGPFAAQAYDAATLLTEAIKQGAKTGDEIKEALETMRLFDGASGSVVFDRNGDVIGGNYDIYIINDGEFVLVNEI